MYRKTYRLAIDTSRGLDFQVQLQVGADSICTAQNSFFLSLASLLMRTRAALISYAQCQGVHW
jgi:hypothetical protein